MSYVVSARKYRPLTFEDVVGQEQITSTLKRAIESDHIAQAFLFCGPRGVGKTTCARILAKAVNTGKTEKLHEITEDFSFNIFELDAASNNKVDDMHQLIAQVRIPPQTGKYKIYIIDEVHMLSTAAFNAFLKTLEEPPPYAIFILATTEKHKILPTILSRCQIYDFKRISVNDIAAHLKNIAAQENIKAEDDALHIIAEKADGALRDALSIFDRLVSFAGDNLTYEAVVKNLNVLDHDYFFKLTDSLLAEDIAAAYLLFDEILAHGFEGDHFVNGMAAHFRNLLVCKDKRTLSLLEVSDSLKERYAQQATITPISFIINALNLASDCDVHYAQSQNKRLLVELMLMKIALISKAIEGASLAEKKNLSSQLASSTSSFEKKTPEPAVKTHAPVSAIPPSSQPKAEEKQVESLPVKKEAPKPQISSFGLSLDDLEKQIESQLGKPKPTENEPADEIEEETPYEKLDFNETNLRTIWEEMIEHFRKLERVSLCDTLYDIEWQVTDGGMALVAHSHVEKNFIEKDLFEMQAFCKKRLYVADFIIEINVDERPENKKIILNTKDKFDLLLKANPLIKELKDRLGLEIEH
jgi:DNA polymerase III subunit gamma/tau